jgi:hypothetical protein
MAGEFLITLMHAAAFNAEREEIRSALRRADLIFQNINLFHFNREARSLKAIDSSR